MKAKQPLRKLIDVWGSLEGNASIHSLIVAILQVKEIQFVRHHGTDGFGRDYWQYKVNRADLHKAQLALPSMLDLQAHGREEGAA
jgi:hypothetical protein